MFPSSHTATRTLQSFSVARVRAASVTIEAMLAHYHTQLDAFICANLAGSNTSALRDKYTQAARAMAAQTSIFGVAKWKLGIAINLLSMLVPTLTGMGEAQALHKSLLCLPSELRLTMLLVAEGSLSLESAGILLSLSVSAARQRIACALKLERSRQRGSALFRAALHMMLPRCRRLHRPATHA